MVENSENQNALLELIVDLKVEALAYQKQADDDHEFALHMMEERDSFERDLAKLERENEELNTRLEIAQEQLEDCTKHELSEKNRQEMWDKLKLDIKANVEARNAEFFGENMEGVE